MIKNSLLLFASIIALLAATALSQQFIAMAVSAPADATANKPKLAHELPPEVHGSGVKDAAPLLLERAGLDRASVHLQILQQSNARFANPRANKKIATDEKKPPVKTDGSI